MAIDEFSGKYRFLSNFYFSSVIYEEVRYPTVEHAFQAAKTVDKKQRMEIYRATYPNQAKHLGKKVTLRQNWEHIKIGIMKDLVRQKFEEPDLANRLLETGDVELIEGNTWGDTFWGTCNRQGLNHLGKILMEVREEIYYGTIPT